MSTVIYDSRWQVLEVASIDEALQCSGDVAEYDAGELSAELFTAYWGVHPAEDFTILSNIA